MDDKKLEASDTYRDTRKARVLIRGDSSDRHFDTRTPVKPLFGLLRRDRSVADTPMRPCNI